LAVAFVAFLAACGDDDHAFDDAGGVDAADAGGRAGADGGRADTSSGGGGNAGTAGAAGTGGSAASGGSAGASGSGGASGGAGVGGAMDASLDRTNDALGGSEAGRDVVAVDTSVEPDDSGIVDSSLDQSGSPDGDASSAEVGDAPAETTEGGDATPVDVGQSDVNDGSLDASSCDDNNAATSDFYSPLYGCGHVFDANPGDGDAWITYDAGFHVDVATGLGWFFPGGFRSASAATSECDALSVTGLSDWRMPTIDDARTLAGGCAPTMSGGTCPLHDPSCLTLSCGQQQPACNSCLGGSGPHPGHGYCKVDVAVCSHFHTSSLCSDCDDASIKDWIYGPSNGNFIDFDPPAGIPTACVSIVPGGVPVADGG
jgi:hypothetical protein